MNLNLNRNTDPRFWDMEHRDCNCGSFAFNLTNWYYPYEGSSCRRTEHICKIMKRFINEVDPLKKAVDVVAEEDAEYMLNMFGDSLKRIYNPSYHIAQGACVIAYRVGAQPEEADYELEYCNYTMIDDDFHFKVYLGNHWYEKQGSSRVRKCFDDSDDDWMINDIDDNFLYNSKTIYFLYNRDC